MQKTGQIERTVDREFADEEAKYKMYVAFIIFRDTLKSLTDNEHKIRERMPGSSEGKQSLPGRNARLVTRCSPFEDSRCAQQ
jgi:hypothetical protein